MTRMIYHDTTYTHMLYILLKCFLFRYYMYTAAVFLPCIFILTDFAVMALTLLWDAAYSATWAIL